MQPNVVNFKDQGHCVISAHERMKQQDCKLEDSGATQPAVFTPLDACTWHAWAWSGVLSAGGAVFLLVTSYLEDTGLGGHFNKSQAS